MLMVNRIIGLCVAAAAVALLYAFPFDGLHPCAWEETAVAAGLLPQGRMLPGLGTYLAHLLFSLFPFGTAMFLTGLVSRLVTGACGYLAFEVFFRMAELTTFAGARNVIRRRLAARIAAATAAFAFVCSQPMWMTAQGRPGLSFLVLLILLAAWFFTRLLDRPTYPMSIATLATLGVLCAETPLGWPLLVLFVCLAGRFVAEAKSELWDDFLSPVRMQKAKWMMTFSFLGVFILGVLLEMCVFALQDGLRAEGITAGELPLAYAKAYFGVIASACDIVGGCLLAFVAVVPTVLVFLLARPATDEETFLPFKYSILFFLCGAVAFLQLSPFDSAWFWTQTENVRVSSPLLLLSMLLSAFVLAWALFVLCVEVLCRDYAHIENVLYQSIGEMSGERPKVTGVRLTPGRLAFLLVPVVLAALIAWGRRLPDDRRLQTLVRAFVNETVDEVAGTKYLFTDGSFDAYLRLEAKRRGVPLAPVSLMSGNSNYDAYVRQLGTQGFEDRMSFETGAAEALRTWVVSKSERISDVSVQLAFEFFRLDRRLNPVVYGLLVRPSGGDPEAAAASVVRCHALADAIVTLHDSGVWRHAKDRLLKDRLLFAQFRLAVISRLRAINLDTAKRVKESIEEIRYSDRLNACNPSLARIVRRMDWIRRQNGDELTPREGLAVAMKRLDFNMARRYAQPILREDPEEPNANFAVGMGFYAEEQYAKAEEYLKRVLKRNPKEPAVYNNLALVCLKTDRLEEAEQYVLKALELKPDQPEIKDTQAQIRKKRDERANPFARPVTKEQSK